MTNSERHIIARRPNHLDPTQKAKPGKSHATTYCLFTRPSGTIKIEGKLYL